jgi:acyl-CoA thioester hydrolase
MDKHSKPGSPLADYPIVITLPVQWGDQDAFQHVNNTVFLRWYESARIAYGEQVGLFELMKTENIGPILASITCHYRLPITYPDVVLIGARISRIGRTSLTMDHVLVSETASTIAAEGTSTLVVYDYKAARSHPVPDQVRKAIEALEGRSFPGRG